MRYIALFIILLIFVSTGVMVSGLLLDNQTLVIVGVCGMVIPPLLFSFFIGVTLLFGNERAFNQVRQVNVDCQS